LTVAGLAIVSADSYETP